MNYTVQQQEDAVMWWNDLPRWKKPGLIEKYFPVCEIPQGTVFCLFIYQICEIYEKETTNRSTPRVIITASYLDVDTEDIEQYKSVVILSKFDWKSRLN